MVTRNLHSWLDFAETLHPKSIDMGLDRVRLVARQLGALAAGNRRHVIIAGTNGKGSTTIATEALLLARGAKVGATLSPHVHRFNERVRVNGEELSDTELCEHFAAVEAARGDVPLTYFEFASLVALQAFNANRVDVALLEVGLGGRLDAFNIVDADLAIVTSIGLDHQEFLGADLESIGREKAGVFRPGQMVVLGQVSASVEAAAEELGCHVVQAGRDFHIRDTGSHWAFEPVAAGLGAALENLPWGRLAPVNFGLAIAAVGRLGGVDREQVCQALQRASLPGRMEQHEYGGRVVLLDVAHNPAGAAFLASQLIARFPGRRYVGILGMLEGKDAAGVTRELAGPVRDWLTVPTTGARGQSAESLAQTLQPSVHALALGSFEEALARSLSLSGGDDGILAVGSFSVVEQARGFLLDVVNPPAPSLPARSSPARSSPAQYSDG